MHLLRGVRQYVRRQHSDLLRLGDKSLSPPESLCGDGFRFSQISLCQFQASIRKSEFMFQSDAIGIDGTEKIRQRVLNRSGYELL